MKNLKKLLLCTAFVLNGSLLLPADGPKKPWWICCASQLSPRDLAHAQDVARRQASLARICALQESVGVAPKHLVRPYTLTDFQAASAILDQNGFPDGYLTSDDHKVFVFEFGGSIQGVCAFLPENNQLSILSVGRAYQRRGIGSALVYAVMYDLKRNRDARVIKVISAEKSLVFYKKLGFTFTDIEGRYELK